MSNSIRYSPEVRARTVRMVLEHQSEYKSELLAPVGRGERRKRCKRSTKYILAKTLRRRDTLP